MADLYKSKAWLALKLKAGLSLKEIGELCNASDETIRLWVNKFGLR